jgi:serine/threonine protein kinase
MTPERWHQVDAIFQAVIELEPAKRAAFLDKSCAGDGQLREEVDSLITSDEQGLSLIDQVVLEIAADLFRSKHPELAEGQHFGHYEIVKPIGSGGMGEVYLAKDKVLNRAVALKLLLLEFTGEEDRLRRFEHEARAASSLNHPNILTIHELGHVGPQQFIATEFVDGETLRQRIRRGRLDFEEGLDVGIQVAGALAEAHQAGIVHRDIKPENIIVRRDGYIKVLDFGLAKLSEQHERTLNAKAAGNVDISSGLVMGTVRYMSPEQAQGLKVDERSDIFSFGVMFYEMITGCAPFAGKTPRDLIAAISEKDPPVLKQYLPNAPAELQRVIAKALTKQKEERYQTAKDLLVDLKNLKKRSAVFNFARLITQTRRHPVTASLALALFLGSVATVSFAIYKNVGRGSRTPFQNMKVTKLTNFGNAFNASISPDGKSVAYSKGDGQGKFSIWLRVIDSTDAGVEIVPPTEGYLYGITFSADGKDIAYGAQLNDQPISTYMIPVSGGNTTKLALTRPTWISFSHDGERLAYFYNNMPEGQTSLVVANSDGTNERLIVKRQAPNYYWSGIKPAWSRDGRLIACVGQNATESFPHVFEVNLENGAERAITAQRWSGIGGVAWLPDMTGLLIVATEETSVIPQVWRIAYPGGEAQRITNDTVSYSGLDLSADGTVLATTKVELPISISVMPVKGAEPFAQNDNALSVDTGNARQIHSGNFGAFAYFENYASLCWTPEGRIVFMSEESGNADIWSMNADGSDRRQLTTDPHYDKGPAVSPDGRYIVFMSNRAGAENIWRMDIDGGNQTRLTSKLIERAPFFSADGRWVLFASWESGKGTIWKIPFDGGQPEQVLTDLAFHAALSPDGRLLVYTGPGKVAIAPWHELQDIKTLEERGGDYDWLRTGRALSYLSGEVSNLWLQPLDGTKPRQLTNFDSNSIWSYGWSRDGKQLAVARVRQTNDVVVINDLGW